MWIASIIHLTDMHLYLTIDDSVRRPVEHEAHIEFLLRQAYRIDSVGWRGLFVGLSEHNRTALRQLKARLPEIVKDERQLAMDAYGERGSSLPIVVVQTGDVEAYGARKVARRTYRFPGWDHLRTAVTSVVADADQGNVHDWIDIFGNHDVWGGAYPLTNPLAHRRVMKSEISKIPGLKGPWPSRCIPTLAVGQSRNLEIYRASSVPEGWLSGVRASGKLTAHPIGSSLPLTGGDDALAELIAVAERDYDPRAIRVLLFHHPIHPFDAGRFQRCIATAAFSDREDVARTIGRVPFHLLIAGHRHSLDPAEGSSRDARRVEQPPLPRGVGQLVAESPTQEPIVFDDMEPSEPAANSLSLYRLLVDEKRSALEVKRTLFRYFDAAEQPFRSLGEETVISDLRLE
jgi:hypothetical protein